MKTKLVAASLSLALMGSAASAVTVYADDFNRANSNTVGNDWAELGFADNDVRVRANTMELRDNRDGAPDAAASSALIDVTGLNNATVSFRWRGRNANEIDDVLNVAWTSDRDATLSDPSEWTSLGTFSTTAGGWTSELLALGAAANDQVIRLLFWTDVSEDNQGNQEGFRIDNVVVAAVPVPAGAPLLLAALGGLGLARRRKAAKS